MTSPKSLLIPVSLVAAAVVALCWWKSGVTAKHDAPVPGGPPAARHTSPPSETPLSAAFDRLGETRDRSGVLQSLAALRAKLAAMPKDEAIAWIRDFLKTGKDKPTGLSFVIGKDGSLTEWPTFRTFLVDSLLAIDPAAAAEISRGILTTPTAADEWALALRNVARAEGTEESRDYLRERTEALIANPAWQADPSIGYLNAFDVLVATNSVESVPLLSGLIQEKDRQDLAHAGFLTLDRLVQRDPIQALGQLAADPALQQSRPEMVAQQFARADIRDEQQRGIVKNWLLDPARTGTELRSFAGVYPNHNRFISDNLLTSEPQQPGAELAEHDRAVLEIVTAWAADPSFQPVNEHLRTMIGRLHAFVGLPPTPDE